MHENVRTNEVLTLISVQTFIEYFQKVSLKNNFAF